MNEKSHIQISVAVVLAGIALIAVILATIYSTPKTALSQCDEYTAVAAIANATGRLPGDPEPHYGAKYSVNPEVCK